jgi:hypothetical protein
MRVQRTTLAINTLAMGNAPVKEIGGSAAQAITPTLEDRRLALFFRHVQNGPEANLLSTLAVIGMDKGRTAKEALTLPYPAEDKGGSAPFFLRVCWLDATRAIITFGFAGDGGVMNIWKARYGVDDELLETGFVGEQPGIGPVYSDEALQLWYYGLGVPV